MTMGLQGGLLRRVFSKGRSCEYNQGRSSSEGASSKVKWVHSVRDYLCGNEINSKRIQQKLEEKQELEDSASHKSSDTILLIRKPNLATESSNSAVRTELYEDRNRDRNEMKELLQEEIAAIAIQSAYKGFMARRRFKEMRQVDKEQEIGAEEEEGEEMVNDDLYENTDAATVDTLSEVQIGESFRTLKLSEESVSLHSKGFSKGRPPVFRVKEEWDDSTLSTNVLKLRIQNRLEATTRRERARAYAFSQQLRTCSTKKRLSRCDSTEPNVSWSWLERWMATRPNPESDSLQPDDCISKNLEEFYATTSRKTILMNNRRLDVSFEGKESCGSNDVSVNFEGFNAKSQGISTTASERNRIVKNKPKASASRSVHRRKVLSENRCNSRSNKVIKKEHSTQKKSSSQEEANDLNTSQSFVEC